MSEHEDFNQPGINLLDPWLINELKKVDPHSTFAWTFKERGTTTERYVSRAEYIKLLILEKLEGR
jgi:hypothetical protein